MHKSQRKLPNTRQHSPRTTVNRTHRQRSTVLTQHKRTVTTSPKVSKVSKKSSQISHDISFYNGKTSHIVHNIPSRTLYMPVLTTHAISRAFSLSQNSNTPQQSNNINLKTVQQPKIRNIVTVSVLPKSSPSIIGGSSISDIHQTSSIAGTQSHQLGGLTFPTTKPFSSDSSHGHDEIRNGIPDDGHGSYERSKPLDPKDSVLLTIIDRNDKSHQINAKIGDNLLLLCRVLHDSNPDLHLEGSCERSLACSTCHIILDDKMYNTVPEPTEVEDDMLDMAACLTPTSRLGCQISLTKDHDGCTVRLPKFSRNFYVDGHVPEPH